MKQAVESDGSEIAEEIETPDLFDENESDNPMLAVEDALDSYGVFRRDADGAFANFDDFLAFREIISR